MRMTPDELLTTTRSVRRRLDFDRPVPRELILECIQVAVQAPTGGNRRGWQWLIVTDPDKKRFVGDRYEQDVARELGIPYERYSQIALLPLAYHTGDSFRPADGCRWTPSFTGNTGRRV
jgi:nitroreductase